MKRKVSLEYYQSLLNAIKAIHYMMNYYVNNHHSGSYIDDLAKQLSDLSFELLSLSICEDY